MVATGGMDSAATDGKLNGKDRAAIAPQFDFDYTFALHASLVAALYALSMSRAVWTLMCEEHMAKYIKYDVPQPMLLVRYSFCTSVLHAVCFGCSETVVNQLTDGRRRTLKFPTLT